MKLLRLNPAQTLPKLRAHTDRPLAERLAKSINLEGIEPSYVPDEPVFFDTANNKISRAEFEDWFAPLNIQRAVAIPGKKVIRLVAVYARDWGAVQLVQIIDANGPVTGVTVARWWPDAPLLDPFPPDCSATRWRDRAVHGLTNEEGHIGFGMGSGDCPPGFSGIFPIHCQAPADWCGGLGWAPGVEHKTAYLIFAITEETDDPPPEPVPDPEPDQRFALLADYLDAVGQMSTSLANQLREDS